MVSWDERGQKPHYILMQYHQKHFPDDSRLHAHHVEKWNAWITLYERQLVLDFAQHVSDESSLRSDTLNEWHDQRQKNMNAILQQYNLINQCKS